MPDLYYVDSAELLARVLIRERSWARRKVERACSGDSELLGHLEALANAARQLRQGGGHMAAADLISAVRKVVLQHFAVMPPRVEQGLQVVRAAIIAKANELVNRSGLLQGLDASVGVNVEGLEPAIRKAAEQLPALKAPSAPASRRHPIQLPPWLLMHGKVASISAVLLAVLAFGLWNIWPADAQVRPIAAAEFMDLATRQIFIGSATAVPPIQSPAGNAAARVYSFTWPGVNDHFAGYYEKYTPEAKAQFEGPDAPDAVSPKLRLISVDGTTWLPSDSPAAQKAIQAATSRADGTIASPWHPPQQ